METCSICGELIVAESHTDAEGRCPRCTSRELVREAPRQAITPIANSAPPTVENIEEHLEKLTQSKGGKLRNTSILLFSLLLFISMGLFDSKLSFVLLLIGVLFLHEAGHFVGMKIFGYRDVHMFFIPFFGAATSGVETEVSGTKKAIVALLGPLPGIFIGIVCWIVYFISDNASLLPAARMFLLLNLFNLLPFPPLDGGRIANDLLFSRHPLLETVFRLIAAIALAGTAFFLHSFALGAVAVYLLITLKIEYWHAKTAHQLRREISPEERCRTKIPRPVIERLAEKIEQEIVRNNLGARAAAVHIDTIWRRACTTPPSAGASAGILILYGATFAISIGAYAVFEALRVRGW